MFTYCFLPLYIHHFAGISQMVILFFVSSSDSLPFRRCLDTSIRFETVRSEGKRYEYARVQESDSTISGPEPMQ